MLDKEPKYKGKKFSCDKFILYANKKDWYYCRAGIIFIREKENGLYRNYHNPIDEDKSIRSFVLQIGLDNL